jgi:iron(III) transport system substrate-binding protein
LHLAAVSAAGAAATRALAAAPWEPSGSTHAAGRLTLAQETTQSAAWDELVAAARAEGRLSLLTVVGGGYGSAVESFEQQFPGIRVDRWAESSANTWLARVREGRRAGGSAFDLAFVQADRALADGAPEGMWAPLRPLLMRPDVLDDRAWRDGLDARFLDTGRSLCFAWEYQVIHAYAINTDLVPAGAIKTVADLLDPRWRGAILTLDPRLGTGLLSAASIARTWGTDLVRQLLVDQQPIIYSSGPDDVTQRLARGDYPIALGVRPKALNPLRARGQGANVQYVDLPDADFVACGSMLSCDHAPHPAAAKLFANWILTREAQTLLASTLTTNSARADVPPFEPDGTATPGAAYYESDREANYEHTAATRQFVHSLLGPPA